LVEVPTSSNETDVGDNLGFDKLAVIVTDPPFSEISVSEIHKKLEVLHRH
jgi:hypothetical protein